MLAAAHGRATLVFLTRAAANSGRLSGWLHANTQPSPPPAHFPRVPQAAAAARVAVKGSVWGAAKKGDTSLVGDHVLADNKCVNAKNDEYDPPPLLARLKMGAQVLFYFGRFKSLVLVVESLHSMSLPMAVTSRLVDCSWRRKLT